MEVVIALGIIGFVLPLIIAAMASTGNDRRKAEAETRSTWMMRNIQREIIAKWSDPPLETKISSEFAFPIGPAHKSEVVMIFDREGTFLTLGSADDLSSRCNIADATFVANVTATAHTGSIARVSITVSQPAKAPPAKRSNITFDYLTTRYGNL